MSEFGIDIGSVAVDGVRGTAMHRSLGPRIEVALGHLIEQRGPPPGPADVPRIDIADAGLAGLAGEDAVAWRIAEALYQAIRRRG
jgi:hypothetical protein